MAFPGNNYAPPGVYTQTNFDNPLSGAIDRLKIPAYIGEGSENLVQSNLEMVRGSSSSIDTHVVDENQASRAVQSINAVTGKVTLGNFDGIRTKFQVRNLPIVNGDGSGTTTNDRSAVAVTVNGTAYLVLSLDGAKGIVELAQAPKENDVVRCTYFFNRTDTAFVDTVSEQVSPANAEMFGTAGKAQIGGVFNVSAGVNDELLITVPSADTATEVSVTLPAGALTPQEISNTISAAVPDLTAQPAINNLGLVVIQLVSPSNIEIGQGSANALLGFAGGAKTSRTTTFITFMGPIVDGSGGGVTTTDPSKVTVLVNGQQTIPAAVNGALREVTLSFAPAAGSSVVITYFQNTWQDTFDYLAHIGISSVTRCGLTPDRADFIDGVDYILKNDTLIWGTSVIVSNVTSTAGAQVFGEKQITATLVDQREFMSVCETTLDTSVVPAVMSSRVFQLSQQPTTGNGRNSPLGTSLFQKVSNNRIDLPTDRPDLVQAFWGFSLNDAVARGAVDVVAVDSGTSQITLGEDVPVGASVFATFFYNNLLDNAFTLSVIQPGAGGTGTYSVSTSAASLFVVDTYTAGNTIPETMGNGLNLAPNFPSGSPLMPNMRFESSPATTFTGPVTEEVTVTFRARNDSLAEFVVPESGDYAFVEDASDQMDLTMNTNGTDQVLSDIRQQVAGGAGALAWVTGDKVNYTAAQGTQFAIDVTNRSLDLTVDGVAVSAVANTNATATAADYAAAVNDAADGQFHVVPNAPTVVVDEVTLSATASDVDGHYVGWQALLIDGTGQAAAGDITFANGNVVDVAAVVTVTVDLTAIGGVSVAVGPIGLVQGNTEVQTAAVVFAALNAATQPGSPLNGACTFTDNNNGTITCDAATPGTSGNLITLLAQSSDGNQTAAPGPAAAPLAGGTLADSGQIRTITGYDGTAQIATVDAAWAGAGAPVVLSRLWVFDPLALPKITGSTKVNGGLTVGNNNHDEVIFQMTDRGGVWAATTVTLAAATYASAALLVTQIQTQLDASLTLNGGPQNNNFAMFPQIEVSSNVLGQIEYTYRRSAVINNGAQGAPLDQSTTGAVIEMIAPAALQDNLGVLLGFSTDAVGGDQPKVYHGPIAFHSTTAGVAPPVNDRLMMCGRMWPGQGNYGPLAGSGPLMSAHHTLSGTGVEVLPGSGNGTVGLTTGTKGAATNKAVVAPASLASSIDLATGQDGNGEYQLTFFSGADPANAANNQFEVTIDGVTIHVTFTANVNGAATLAPLGSVNADTNAPGTVLGQLEAALVTNGSFGNLAAVRAAQLIRREGAGIRITSASSATQSGVLVGSGSANAVLGFSDNVSATRSVVSPEALSSFLNCDGGANSILPGNVNYPDAAGGAAAIAGFRAQGYALVAVDDAGLKYTGIQSWVDLQAVAGTTSIILFGNSANRDAFRHGTGTGIPAAITAATDPDLFMGQGEAGVEGFTVSSDNPVGSGSANTAILSLAGQDGIVGQTYRDDVTGLTFTIIPAGGGIAYTPAGTFRVKVTDTWTADGSIPVPLPGCNLVVTDTWQTMAGNTARVETFKRNSRDSATGLTLGQPAVGDIYYVSYIYTKQDMTPSLYSKFSAIERAFGPLSPDNPITLASYLAMLNGAVLVGCAQTKKETGSAFASETTYKEVIDALNRPMPGFVTADVLVPLKGDSTALYQYISQNVDVQSSIRYRQERTAILGVAPGTDMAAIGTLAQLISNTRMRLVYPDTATLTLTDALGNQREYIVDGTYVAAALSGNRCSPTLDVASPWTGAGLVGFNQLGRQLDAVEQNQTAVKGVTVMVDQPPFLRVRQGFTTDMTNILTKTPTIIQIADEVQQNCRGTLSPFVGIKFLPGILSQIEGRVAMMLKGMMGANVISAYTGVRAKISPADPTVAEVEAYYQPIFPLLYLVVTFNLRSSLGT
jgi:hypothetical protein